MILDHQNLSFPRSCVKRFSGIARTGVANQSSTANLARPQVRRTALSRPVIGKDIRGLDDVGHIVGVFGCAESDRHGSFKPDTIHCEFPKGLQSGACKIVPSQAAYAVREAAQ